MDGPAHAQRAVEFVSGLDVPDGGAVTLISVVEPVRPASVGLLPASVHGAVAAGLAALEAERRRAAERVIDGAARRLKRAGWTVDTQVRLGIPLAELLVATGSPTRTFSCRALATFDSELSFLVVTSVRATRTLPTKQNARPETPTWSS